MAKQNDPKFTLKVASVPQSKSRTGAMVTTAGGFSKQAYSSVGNTTMGSGGNFYSPELSPDFLELPQTIDEQRNYYRFFYDNDPFVRQAVDLHTELPLSKLRLRKPAAKSREIAEAATRFCDRWARKVGLLHRLIEVCHDLELLGEVYVFCEDTNPDPPRHITHKQVYELTEEGTAEPREVPYEDADARLAAWLVKNYKGWTSVQVLPPEQVHAESFPFTSKKLLSLIPDSKTKAIIDRAASGDERAADVVSSMPDEIVDYIMRGENIPLNTNPYAGSFCHVMSRKKSQYEARGKSCLQPVIRTLIYRDKLRQAQTSIASRHMTPYRIVWGENLSAAQMDDLRDQVDLALRDPDYSLITNFQVNWEERGAGTDNRLLELSGEYEMTDRQLYAGLGVTESLLSGESSYSGDRINLEVINTRYMLLRELLQDFVDENIFAPMCARMGFVETDEDGNEVVVHPRLSFTRLALRDNQETFTSLFDLYQKGSLDVDSIYDLLNLDPDTVKDNLKKDVLTLNDSTFNEVLRAMYSAVGQELATGSDVIAKIAAGLGLKYTKPKEEGGGRFS